MTNQEFTAKMNGHAENYVKHANQFRRQFRGLAAYVLFMSISMSVLATFLSLNEGSPLVSALSIAMLFIGRLYVRWGNESWDRMMKGRQACMEERDQVLRSCSEDFE